jgi:NAD(P)H-hydrate epimerase
LHNWGYDVEVLIACKPEEVSGDARLHLETLRRTNVPVTAVGDAPQVTQAASALNEADVVVDALLGTGLSGKVEGAYAELIQAMNAAPGKVVSVDVPSGLEADTGRPAGVCVAADVTVTMGLPKLGLYLGKGPDYTGDVLVQELGIPPECQERVAVDAELLSGSIIGKMLPRRARTAHKGDAGKAYIAAGSVGMTGAACLAADAALKAGTGLVYLGVPGTLNPIFEMKLTEVITFPLRESPEQALDLAAAPAIEEGMAAAEATAVGPGMSRAPRTCQLVRKLVEDVAVPMVIDADGLFALAENLDVLKRAAAARILTPHVGEMARLLGKTPEEVLFDAPALCREFAHRYQVIVVLKQARTIICEPAGRIHINPTGNPGMATAGSGDVLTGLIVGLLAQGLEPWQAAGAGVYVHGFAGDMAARRLGEASTTAGAILAEVPQALRVLESRVFGVESLLGSTVLDP